jgi:glutathione synthase/RimK-type ligase-like ATP-grasp enzyme
MSSSSVNQVAFVTCKTLPNLDPDDILAVNCLEKHHIRCVPAVWNDPGMDWSTSRLVVLRSTWDYHLSVEKFLSWAESCAERLANSYALVRWNYHKGYLLELNNRGIPTIATVLLPKNSSAEWPAMDWVDVVIKPAVGLATHGVKRFVLSGDAAHAEAQEHAATLAKTNDVLIQPFMPSVSEYGERALVFFDGNFSHAVRKTAFQALAVAGKAGETSVAAATDEIELGYKALAALSETPLYARIDIVRDENKRPIIMELELIEPSLFLAFDEQAPERFATAIRRRL